MLDKIIISVIVPVYNAEKYLERCLKSILSQTFKDFELILVDDGSPDSCGEICDHYAKLDSRVHVVHQENQGVSAARQTGLDAAEGEYVIFADPDDWVESIMLEELLRQAETVKADVVICDMVRESLVNGVVKEHYFEQRPRTLKPQDIVSQLLLGELYGSTCNKLYRVKTLKKKGIFFPVGVNYCEDLWFNCKLFMHSDLKVSYKNKAYYHYDLYSNDSSLTRKINLSTMRDYLKLVDFIDNNLDKAIFSYELKWIKFNAKKTAFRTDCNTSEFYSIYPEETENSKQILLQSSYHFVFKWGLWLALNGYLNSGRNLMRIYDNWYLPIAKLRHRFFH